MIKYQGLFIVADLCLHPIVMVSPSVKGLGMPLAILSDRGRGVGGENFKGQNLCMSHARASYA